MPPKTQFTKEQIIEAAFHIACQEGLDSITIRKVAERLGSSIAPIYVNFENVEELVQAVVSKTFSVAQRLLAEQDTGSPFFDLGAASLRFAREYSQLFRDLVLQGSRQMRRYDQELGPEVIAHMKKDPELTGFSDEELKDILLKMRMFQIGLSVMVANRLLPEEYDEAATLAMLHSTGSDVIRAARMRQNQPNKKENKE
jgi:AcrR family transcriptional regulator